MATAQCLILYVQPILYIWIDLSNWAAPPTRLPADERLGAITLLIRQSCDEEGLLYCWRVTPTWREVPHETGIRSNPSSSSLPSFSPRSFSYALNEQSKPGPIYPQNRLGSHAKQVCLNAQRTTRNTSTSALPFPPLPFSISLSHIQVLAEL